jgi:hypothetical protein
MRVWWGAVAQLGERLVRNEEVSGSIPLSSTIDWTTYDTYGNLDTFAVTSPCTFRISELPLPFIKASEASVFRATKRTIWGGLAASR